MAKFKVTSHKEIPPKRRRTGLTEALRALQVNHSLYVPPDGAIDFQRQRSRLSSVVQLLQLKGEGFFSVRSNAEKGGFDIYRTE